MTLSLISPPSSNFVKDFPGQNATNLDRIDDYAGPSALASPLQSFSPTLTGSTTDPVLGTGGINRAHYYEIFDQIYAWGEFRFGTAGINIGSGAYIINLPFVADTANFIPNAILGSAPVVGTAALMDASLNAGRFPLLVHLRTPSSIYFSVRLTSGLVQRDVRESGMITWAINDGITWNARFKRVP